MTSSDRTSRRHGIPVPPVDNPENIIRSQSGSRPSSRPTSRPQSRIPSPSQALSRRGSPLQQQLFTPPVSTAQPHHNTLPCYQRSHLFDHTEWIDYYADPAGGTNFKACRSSPCPNCCDLPLLQPVRGNNWALPIAEGQEEAIRSHQRHRNTSQSSTHLPTHFSTTSNTSATAATTIYIICC